jgi:hypothetical protein
LNDATVELIGGAYGKLIVDSGGSGNTLVLDATTPEIDVAGPTAPATTTAPLTISGDALDIGTLHKFDGSLATGALDVFFEGTGHVAAIGGSGDDTFTFTTIPGGGATFSDASTVDGGAGTNLLVIEADHGSILDAGEGAGIKNIQTIVHETVPGGLGANGDFSADLKGMGSATTFDLAGNYNGHDVHVTDITNALTEEYSGSNLDDLFLVHTTPAAGFINFEMNGGVTLNQLHVAAGLDELNIDSTGGGNDIETRT